MKRHGKEPSINRIPGQEFGLSISLKKKAQAPAPIIVNETVIEGGGCECDITGLFWMNQETGTVFDSTINEHNGSAYYLAKIVGDICPGATISITVTWTGSGSIDYNIVDHVVIVNGVLIPGSGTVIVGGSIDCDGDVTNFSNIFLVSF